MYWHYVSDSDVCAIYEMYNYVYIYSIGLNKIMNLNFTVLWKKFEIQT